MQPLYRCLLANCGYFKEMNQIKCDYLESNSHLFVDSRNYRVMVRLISALQHDMREALIAVREMSRLLSMKLVSVKQRFSQRDLSQNR